ncbi:MAG: transposase [Thaumarchaeota archaeon]|nr:transposase [Nitrososphaerota archaeon]
MLCLKYQTHNHLVYSCKYYVIFCPKYRRKILVGKTAERIKELILEKQSQSSVGAVTLDVVKKYIEDQK